MMKTKKKISLFLMGIVACLSICLGAFTLIPKFSSDNVAKAATFNTKDVAMLGSIAGWYGNGNFQIRFTLGEADWDKTVQDVETSPRKYSGELRTLFASMDFFNHVKLGDKTLAQWGCTACYDNCYWLNLSEPDYTIMFPFSMGAENMSKATEAGIGANTRITILEGLLIPSKAYLEGDTTATVYRAGCDFVTENSGVAYGLMATGKTEVQSIDYVTGWDSTLKNAYLGVTLKGDDFLGDGTVVERHPDYYSSVYTTNHFPNKITVDGETGKTEAYGLFNHGKSGYYSFVIRAKEEESESITIPAGTLFPSRAMRTLFEVNGNPVYMMYQTQTDVTFYKQPDGSWAKPLVEEETNVTSVEYKEGFVVAFLSNHDYPTDAYTVDVKDRLSSLNFFNSIEIDGQLASASPVASTGAFLNVWGGYYGSFATYLPNSLVPTEKITFKKGCQFPSYALQQSVDNRVCYTLQEDITFVKNESGVWEKYVPEGDFDTEVTQVQFGRDNTNVLNINLSVNDYPAPNGDDASTYNIDVVKEKILALNFYDNVIVDGYTLRSLYTRYGENCSNAMWINKFVGHNFAITVPSENGEKLNPNKIVIRAGTQFPSLAYVKNTDVKAFYVTTKEVTYVRISGNVNENWAKQSKITFVADGKTVTTRTYTKENGIDGGVPYVPDKDGHKGVWESYTLNGEDLVVKAKYISHDFSETETNVSKIEYREAFILLYLTNSDYMGKGFTMDVKDRMSTMHFFNFLEIDGKMVTESPTAIHGAYINVWGGTEGSFATYIPNDIVPQNKVVIKKGCQIPSNAYRLDPNNKTCYVLTEDVTFNYENGAWVRQSSGEDEVISSKPTYENEYLLSDLHNTGHSPSAELEKGYLIVDKSTDGKVYGYNTSDSFSLTFDFSLNIGSNDVSAQGNYATFTIAMATRGYNSTHTFGWRIYLYRPNNTQKCVEIYSPKSDYYEVYEDGKDNGGNITSFNWDSAQFEKGKTYRVTFGYKLLDATNGTVEIYINVDGYEMKQSYVLGAQYMNYAPYVDSIAFATTSAITNGVRISDPGVADGEQNHTVTLSNGTTQILSEKTSVYTLPTLSAYEYAQQGDVFVGWTTDTVTLPNLYPAGYELKIGADTTLYPVWINFALKDGAAVRKTGDSGIRFTVNVSGSAYQTGLNKGLIVGAGTLVVPTSYLDSGKEFIHESFPEGYFVDVPTTLWTNQTGDVWSYVAALINISPSQYTRAMSARGYLKVKYSDDSVGYVYTAYSKDLHSRSIYEVATKAYAKGDTGTTVTDYLDNVADIVINEGLEVSKNGKGNYSVESAKDGLSYTLTVDKAVKAVMINGVRLVMGYDAEILVGNALYSVSGYKLSSNGLTITFTLETGDETAYYASIVEYYKNSTDYTELHKKKIDAIIEEWGDNYSNSEVNATYLAQLESIKTETELKNDVGTTQLAMPVVTYGLGYSVTWQEVENADYYYVTDDNDYRNGVYVTENSYKPEVVGKHNVTVTAYSYNEEYKTSAQSAEFATIEVKPVFTYKAMTNGLYKFSEAQMKTLGLGNGLNTKNDGSSYYYDKTDKLFFAYYNKEKGWSKDQSNATDWTSPKEFPAHAKKLKAMGNNVLLLAEDTTASLKEDSVWETSRTKYVMDTAWSMGLKVIVCDDVLYKQSKEVESKSKALTEINKRSALLEAYLKHPAFYGFSLEDEPEPNSLFTGSEMESVGFMVQALKEKCASLGYSKENGNEPFFLACLYQLASGFESFGSIVGYDDYLNDWFDGTGLDYVYVDLYTGHAMGDKTNRYELTYNTIYGSNGEGGIVTGTSGRKFYQVITAHTQDKDNDGILRDQDMYMSMLYAAAHNVAGYSWFCYFPIVSEFAASMVGYDGDGYGNGYVNGTQINGAENGKHYYETAKKAGYQYELIQGVLNGYSFTSRNYNSNLLTTTLSNGSNTITMYVNADTMNMSGNVTVTASSSGYLVGYGLDGYYQDVENGESVTLTPGQALICLS